MPQLNQKQLEELLKLKDKEVIEKNDLFLLFSRRVIKENNKVVKIDDPFINATDTFIVKPSMLPNVAKDIETTAGRFVLNLYLFTQVFGDKIPYFNETAHGDKVILQIVNEKLLTSEITPEQFGDFQNRLVFLGNCSEIFIPGMSPGILAPNPKVIKKKKELIAQYKDEIENGNHVLFADKVEKELLKIAEDELNDDYGWPLFDYGGKPSFGNNYKNSTTVVGPIWNPIESKFEISTNSLLEGIPKEQMQYYGNSLIMGSYSRGVMTQYSGYQSKLLFAAGQSLIADEPGTDCGTKLYLTVNLDKDNIDSFIWQYIVEGSRLVLLTNENMSKYIGKTVKMRSALFCRTDKICNKCLGEMFYNIGIKNIGLVLTRVTSSIMNSALKSMHDSTIKVTKIDPFQYFYKVVE